MGTMGDWYLRRASTVGSNSRGRSAGSEDSAHSNDFDASMDSGVSLEALESQLLPGSFGEADSWNYARRSTSCCTGAERREIEKLRWSSLQRRKENVTDLNSGVVGSSCRSEDSEILALWEEKSEAADRLGGSRRGRAASNDLRTQKPTGLQSPWRESVSNAVKKIESLSHAVVNNKEKLRSPWARTSPIHSKAGAVALDSPRLSVDKKAGGRSPWRDFKIMTNSSPMKTTGSLLHNSPKARYSQGSPCRRMDRSEFESSSPSLITAPKLFHEAVSCELQCSSSAPARSLDFNFRRQVDESEAERSLWRDAIQDTAVQKNGNELESSCVQSPIQSERSSNREDVSKRLTGRIQSCETTTTNSQETPLRQATSAISSKSDDVVSPPRTIAAAAERALSRQSTKLSMEAVGGALTSLRSTKVSVEAAERALSQISLEAMSLSMDRCSAPSMDEAMLNEYANEAGEQRPREQTLTSQEAGERKASHRYYQKVTSRERSLRWSSNDDNHLDAIDLVAPSAARFLEDEGCVSPTTAPIKTPGAVPFEWEKEPGKPKKDSESATNQFQSALQLPPRLAVSQHASSPNRYDMAMSAPLIQPYALPTPESIPSEAQRVQLYRSRTILERTVQDSCPSSSLRGPGSGAAMESPVTKSRSVCEVKTALRTLSRISLGDAGIGDTVGDIVGDAGDQGIEQDLSAHNAPLVTKPNHQKPAHLPGSVRPPSPTSILCGPGDGSRPSSNSSLFSDLEGPLISVRIASSLSHCGSPARASFDSIEHSIEHDSEMMSPGSSLTSPLRANTRCNSMSFNDSDLACNFRRERQEGSAYSENAFVKFCKNGKRWMKSRAHSKLGTIHSPEVSAPGLVNRQYQRDEIQDSGAQFNNLSSASRFLHVEPSMAEQRATSSSDFSARLGHKPSPLPLISKIDRSNVQTDCRFAPITSSLPYEDLENRSPAYAATLELLSPLHEFSSKKKKKKNLQMASSSKTTRKRTQRLRVRVRVRVRFLVPIRRALKKLFLRCAFRRRTVKVKAAESKLLYHVDYTLSPADFRFCKPN